jgi:hypothetical protein
MAFDRLEIGISLQKLLSGLILVVVRPASQSQGTASSQFINDRVLDIAALARKPAVVDAITAAQRHPSRRWSRRRQSAALPSAERGVWQAVYGEGRGGVYVSEIDNDSTLHWCGPCAGGCFQSPVPFPKRGNRPDRAHHAGSGRWHLDWCSEHGPLAEVEVGRMRFRARGTRYAAREAGGVYCRQYDMKKRIVGFSIGLSHFCFVDGGSRVADVDAYGLLLLAPKTAVCRIEAKFGLPRVTQCSTVVVWVGQRSGVCLWRQNGAIEGDGA